MDLAAPEHLESSQNRGRTHVPCIGRQILKRWTTREVLSDIFKWRGGIIGVRLSQDGSGCRNRGQAVGNKRGSRQISKKATSVIQAKDSHGFSEAAAMRC